MVVNVGGILSLQERPVLTRYRTGILIQRRHKGVVEFLAPYTERK